MAVCARRRHRPRPGPARRPRPYPLMLELEARTRAYLDGRAHARRGRDLYRAIARWLALTRRANSRLNEPTLRLAQELRAEFPTLRGLKEELEKERLLGKG
ncbi:MAG: hypothetical protein WKG07_48515 [Hymenobacter sp.]